MTSSRVQSSRAVRPEVAAAAPPGGSSARMSFSLWPSISRDPTALGVDRGYYIAAPERSRDARCGIPDPEFRESPIAVSACGYMLSCLVVIQGVKQEQVRIDRLGPEELLDAVHQAE